jgi:hypothetical protein
MIRNSETLRNKEAKHFTKSGEERFLLTNISFTEVDGVTYLLVTNQDITENRRLMNELVTASSLPEPLWTTCPSASLSIPISRR